MKSTLSMSSERLETETRTDNTSGGSAMYIARTRCSSTCTTRRYSAWRRASRVVSIRSFALSSSKRARCEVSSPSRRSRLRCASSTAACADRSALATAESCDVRTPSRSFAAPISCWSVEMRESTRGFRLPTPAPGAGAATASHRATAETRQQRRLLATRGARRGRRSRRRAAPRTRAPQRSTGGRYPDVVRAGNEPALLAGVRPERDHRAEDEHEPGEPDQVHERLHEDAEVHGSVRIDLIGDDEEVLHAQPVGPDPDLVRDLLLHGVGVLARLQGAEVAAVAAYVEPRSHLHRVRTLLLRELSVAERVVADPHRLTRLELCLRNRIEGARPGDSDGEQDDRGMNDIAPVPPAVTGDERRERPRPRRVRQRLSRARPPGELDRDRRDHERREGVRQESRDGAPRAEEDQGHAGDERRDRRPAERGHEAPRRRPSPGDERADPHQQQERQPEDPKEEVVVRAPEDDRLAADRLREERVHDAPEDRQTEGEEQEVVVEERRLP